LAFNDCARAQESSSDWQFYFTPYLWMTGLGTETRGVGPIPPTDTDVDFSQIWDHLNIALQGNFEARRGRFFTIVDFNYFDLSVDKDLSGPVFTKLDLNMTGLLASASAGYWAIESDFASFGAFGGVQVFSTDIDLALQGMISPSRSGEVTLVDPIIGVRSAIDLGSGFFINGSGTIGGFGVDSKLTWQLFGGIGWQANDWLALRAGYRHFVIEQGDGKFIEEITMTGPVIGATFRF
jgi:opacity protein-like surface antigen